MARAKYRGRGTDSYPGEKIKTNGNVHITLWLHPLNVSKQFCARKLPEDATTDALWAWHNYWARCAYQIQIIDVRCLLTHKTLVTLVMETSITFSPFLTSLDLYCLFCFQLYIFINDSIEFVALPRCHIVISFIDIQTLLLTDCNYVPLCWPVIASMQLLELPFHFRNLWYLCLGLTR